MTPFSTSARSAIAGRPSIRSSSAFTTSTTTRRGTSEFGPAVPLTGHEIGQDFEGVDGWRMYHGDVVPGFPQHPHRGFETVTIIRRGYIDHSDSLGAAARFGAGDVQWLTAGAGVVHSEMFPLLNREGPNTLELFQIWLNLPSKDKLVEPYFTMLWDREIPRRVFTDAARRRTEVMIIAGALEGTMPLAPPPHSWASKPESDLAIWSISLEKDATWTVPPATGPHTLRTLNFFAGTSLRVAGRLVMGTSAVQVQANQPITIEAVDGPADVLLLQGRPIGEPVAQYGPFVMNTPGGIAARLQRLPAHAFRWVAVAGECARPRSRPGAIRKTCRRSHRAHRRGSHARDEVKRPSANPRNE